MKKIQVRVIVGSGSTQVLTETIYDDISGFTYSESGFYTFYDKDKHEHFYPTSHTIIHQLE